MRKIFMTAAVLLMALNLYGEGKKVPIIYSDNYNITLYGIQRLHPFETEKYGKVWKYLKDELGIDEKDIYRPSRVSEEDLRMVHTEEYLKSLNESSVVAGIAELDALRLVPNFILKRNLLEPMLYAAGGTVMGVELALEYGWAINLSGGYHHAKPDKGEGFCYYADIPIAVKKLRQKGNNIRILIIDLDAHQGNGLAMSLKDDKYVYILDVYNEMIYPGDVEAKKYINFNHPIKANTEGPEYLKIVRKAVKDAIAEAAPELIIYNAGTDILEGDPLGMLNVLGEEIVERDEIIFKEASGNKIPILMVLSGGYTYASVDVIGRSVKNLYLKLFKERFETGT